MLRSSQVLWLENVLKFLESRPAKGIEGIEGCCYIPANGFKLSTNTEQMCLNCMTYTEQMDLNCVPTRNKCV